MRHACTLVLVVLVMMGQAPGPGPAVRITAVDAATGKPIALFKARTVIKSGEKSLNILRKGVDGKAEAVLPAVGEAYVIQVEADGYAAEESAVLTPHNGVLAFEARLKQANLDAGKVLLPDGKPAAGAAVILTDSKYGMLIKNGHLQNQSFETSTMARTNDDGRYQFPSQSGPMRAIVLHDEGWAEIRTDGIASCPLSFPPENYARRRRINTPHAPAPSNASVAGSGTAFPVAYTRVVPSSEKTNPPLLSRNSNCGGPTV